MDEKKMFKWTLIGLILMFATLLLSGCRSSKQTTQTDIERTEQHKVETNLDINQQAALDIYRFVSKHTRAKLDFVIYDTDKPPDEHGNYPVKAEGQLNAESDIQSDTSISKIDSTNIQIADKSASELKEKDNSTMIKETDEASGAKQWKWIIWGGIVLIMVYEISVWFRK